MGVEVRARSREVSAKGRRDEETRRRPGRLSGDRGVSKGGGEGREKKRCVSLILSVPLFFFLFLFRDVEIQTSVSNM